jgi:hypothetical protein
MSANLRAHLSLLEQVSKKRVCKKRVDLMREIFTPELYLAILEIVHNITNKQIELNISSARKLKPHKYIIRELKSNPKGIRRKKELVAQSGGFMNIVIPLILAALNGLLS